MNTNTLNKQVYLNRFLRKIESYENKTQEPFYAVLRIREAAAAE